MDTCTQTKDEARVVLIEDEIAACDEDFSRSGDGDRHCGEEVIRTIGGWCLESIYILGGAQKRSVHPKSYKSTRIHVK